MSAKHTPFRVTWVDPRARTEEGIAASRDAVLALLRGPVGSGPVALPANGIQRDGGLRFTDRDGRAARAGVGDVIEVGGNGWKVVGATP